MPKKMLLISRGVAVLVLLLCLGVSGAGASDLPSDSLYAVPLSFRDQRGRNVRLDSFKGTPVVLTLAYTRCESACPMTMQRMKQLSEKVGSKVPDLKFIIVSLDPAHDTPATLTDFQKRYNLSEEKWHLLNSSEADLRKLSILLGYSYQRQEGNDQIAHSNKVVALSRSGAIATQLEGLEGGLDEFARQIISTAAR